jgi:S-DNA-T family DNA segregation ATPase FtsK/SpoIIIE
MEKRYRSMNQFGARSLESYNDAVKSLSKEQIEEHEKINTDLDSAPGRKNEKYYFQELPFIVIILEEFGDLMTVDKNNVEHSVVRLAQKARASGIHLVLAMQSPRKEVVTGLIKTNIPGRIAFKVSSAQDSRVILDENGAERLLQQGDMLFKSPGSSNLVRHHGPFLKDSEVVDIAKFWSQQAEPEFDPAIMKTLEGGMDPLGTGLDGDQEEQEYDEIYDQVLSWASAQKTISASLIQRNFQIGYPRAARLVDVFEREGVVGPASGSKPRQVLVNNLASLDE